MPGWLRYIHMADPEDARRIGRSSIVWWVAITTITLGFLLYMYAYYRQYALLTQAERPAIYSEYLSNDQYQTMEWLARIVAILNFWMNFSKFVQMLILVGFTLIPKAYEGFSRMVSKISWIDPHRQILIGLLFYLCFTIFEGVFSVLIIIPGILFSGVPFDQAVKFVMNELLLLLASFGAKAFAFFPLLAITTYLSKKSPKTAISLSAISIIFLMIFADTIFTLFILPNYV